MYFLYWIIIKQRKRAAKMPTKKGQAPPDLRYFAKKSVGRRALETHLRHEPTPPTVAKHCA